MINKKILGLACASLLFIAGCSSKRVGIPQENLTANQIHSKLYHAINTGYIDNADDIFLNMEAQYPGSIYIKSDLLMLYLAHLKTKEYILAKYYLNQYETRFASQKEIPWCEYQKIKIDFLAYENPYTNQGQLLKLIKECENYQVKYPNSPFLYEVNTIYVKALLTNLYLDAKISKLYKKEKKPKAANFYKVKIPKNSKPPVIPWYKKIFYW
jgi:outer membrane protein assembly factor BamD